MPILLHNCITVQLINYRSDELHIGTSVYGRLYKHGTTFIYLYSDLASGLPWNFSRYQSYDLSCDLSGDLN